MTVIQTTAPQTSRAGAVLTATADRHRRRVRRERLAVQVGIVALGVAFLLFWQFALGHLVNPRYVSTPAVIATRLLELVAEGEIFGHLRVTLVEAGSGFLIGVVLGLVAAFTLAMTRRGYEVLEPFLIAFYSIPKIALAPLFILWFGLGYTPKVLLAALMVFFIVFMNTVAGIRAIQPGLVEVSRVFGASRRELVAKVMAPAAAPAILASVRITFTRAIEGAVLAEFIASTEGLGFLIVRASRQFDIATVFAGILVIAAVVMVANGLLRLVQARLLPWHSGQVHG